MINNDLTLKQQQFCKHYIENKGNATRAYMKAFTTRKYDTSKVEASKLLTKPNISGKIAELMEEGWFNNIYIDFELMKTIQQDKNLYAKLRGIEIYNKIKNRYSEQPSNNYSDIDVSTLSVEEIIKMLKSK